MTQSKENLFVQGASRQKRAIPDLVYRFFTSVASPSDAATNDNANICRTPAVNDKQPCARHSALRENRANAPSAPEAPTFSEAMRGAAAQDPSLVTLYHEYSSALVGHVRRIVGDADEAADVVQGMFVSIMEKDALRTVVNPRSYLYRAAHNAALDHLRSAYHRNKAQGDNETTDDYEDEGALCAERAMIGRQNLSIVMKAMEALSARQQRILVEYHIDGRAWAEVARSAGVSIRTAQYECSRALTALKKELGERC